MQNQFAGGSPWVNALRRAGGLNIGATPPGQGGPTFGAPRFNFGQSPGQGGPTAGVPSFRSLNPNPGMSYQDIFRRYGGGMLPNPGTAMTAGPSRPGTSMGMMGSRGIGPQQLAQLRQQHIQQNRIPAARNPVY